MEKREQITGYYSVWVYREEVGTGEVWYENEGGENYRVRGGGGKGGRGRTGGG